MFKITLTVADRLPATVEKKLREVFNDVPVHTVEKIKNASSRAERLAEAEAKADDAFSEVEELKGEMEDWRDSVPENLQGGDKYSHIEEVIDILDQIMDGLATARDEMSNVEFPGMLG